MVRVEVLTAGDYKSDHSNFKMVYAIHPTPFGNCMIGIRDSDKAIGHLAFADKNLKEALKLLERDWPLSDLVEDELHETKKIIDNVFAEDGKLNDSIAILLKGTEFQIEVWKALMSIPRGTTTTYEKVAEMINKPKAIRAAANALMKNPVCYIVPCHRVMGKSGSNKYAWGVEKKLSILAYEKGLH